MGGPFGDILRYVGGVWSLEFDGSNADADWGPADLDALQVPEPTGAPGLGAGLAALALLGARRLSSSSRGWNRFDRAGGKWSK